MSHNGSQWQVLACHYKTQYPNVHIARDQKTSSFFFKSISACRFVVMAPPATARYDWILAITCISFVFSAFGNGANDVANSYATSVAAQTLTMPQVGFLSIITEFVGAVALGSRVTDTIKNGIITIDRFREAANPGTLMLAMGCAEIGSASWLMFATVCLFFASSVFVVRWFLVADPY